MLKLMSPLNERATLYNVPYLRETHLHLAEMEMNDQLACEWVVHFTEVTYNLNWYSSDELIWTLLLAHQATCNWSLYFVYEVNWLFILASRLVWSVSTDGFVYTLHTY